MMTIALLAAPLALTSVEFCSAAPDPPATAPPEWHWRMVDGKKCYFRADKLLPREDLLWTYDAKQLDLDEGNGQRSTALRTAGIESHRPNQAPNARERPTAAQAQENPHTPQTR
jgi:hypothetical protein